MMHIFRRPWAGAKAREDFTFSGHSAHTTFSSGRSHVDTDQRYLNEPLGIARRGHAALHEYHAGESIAPATAMDLARQVNEALWSAHAKHDKVLRRNSEPTVE